MQANQQPSSARASEAPNMVFAVEPFANGARSVGFSELIEANYAEMERHKQLRKTLRTLDETKMRMEAFHNALLGIHRQ